MRLKRENHYIIKIEFSYVSISSAATSALQNTHNSIDSTGNVSIGSLNNDKKLSKKEQVISRIKTKKKTSKKQKTLT